MKFEAFVYGYVNIVNGKRYIGWHLSSETNDGYTFSSEDQELNEAWSFGHLRRSILARGEQSHMITMERKLLKHVDARRNDNWYNKTNGGGKGCGDYTLISDEEAKVGIDWINGIEPVEEHDIYDLIDIELVESIWKDVKEKRYQEYEEPIELIKTFKKSQVRLVDLDHGHAEMIADRMKDNPAEGREIIEPIIVCVDKHDGKRIINGNHTREAVIKAGWASAPVIYINKSLFLDRQSNIEEFGRLANDVKKIVKPQSTKDCQLAIIRLYSSELAAKDDENFSMLMSDRFKDSCIHSLSKHWTKRQIASNIASARKRIKTDAAEAKLNFKRYSDSELSAKREEYENDDTAVISVSSGTVYNAGIGAIMNKMGGMGVWNGVIITHHHGIDEYENWSSSENKLKEAMQRLHPDTNVQCVVLPCFVDNES